MHQSHGVGYAEYGRKLSKILNVEKRRENSYKKSLNVVKDIERQVHR
ncbi:hypothetical protein [Gracilibacillus salinarum]|uniref:Uncharacterized protein n=1 Tax=Gracilibacillus salinarum TaxID=2932255 RepID=A0ABY4GMW1_9BACI|nr:hypothetical protein [Gracilibacillus salinarum]UOQ85295.1 hypothetical protein MUN87_22085 [Gracilibacillus salinarum]